MTSSSVPSSLVFLPPHSVLAHIHAGCCSSNMPRSCLPVGSTWLSLGPDCSVLIFHGSFGPFGSELPCHLPSEGSHDHIKCHLPSSICPSTVVALDLHSYIPCFSFFMALVTLCLYFHTCEHAHCCLPSWDKGRGTESGLFPPGSQ